MSLKLPKVVHKLAWILHPCAVASSLPFVWYALCLLSPEQMIIAHYLRGLVLPEHLLVSPGNNFSNMDPTTISTRLHPANVALCTFTCGYRLYSHSRHRGEVTELHPQKAEGGPKSVVRRFPAARASDGRNTAVTGTLNTRTDVAYLLLQSHCSAGAQ